VGRNHHLLSTGTLSKMNTFLLILGASIFILVLLIWQFKTIGKKHPNAEMLVRFYQMII